MLTQFGLGTRLVVGGDIIEADRLTGTPFGGGYGRMLQSFYRKAAVNLPDLSFVKGATDEELKHILSLRPWNRIDAIGEKALRQLTDKDSIMKWRGFATECKLIGSTTPIVMPILEPEYLVKDSSMIPATISDMGKGIAVPPQYYNTKATFDDIANFTATNFCFDIETNRYTNQITMVGLSCKPYHVLVVPFQGRYIDELKRIFANATRVIGQNIVGFDLIRLADNSVTIKQECEIWDIMLMQHLLQPDLPHDLEFIASIWTQMQAWKFMNKVDMAWYCCGDVDATFQSFEAIYPVLVQQGLLALYRDVQVPLARLCKMMSDIGIKKDPARIKIARTKFLAEMAIECAKLPKELQTYEKAIKVRQKAPEGTLGKAGRPIKYIHIPGTEEVTPWQSPKRVQSYLYDQLDLPVQYAKKLKPGQKEKSISTDKMAIERLWKEQKKRDAKNGTNLADGINAIRKVRSLDELIGTFLQLDTNAPTTPIRIHANFLVHGTNTGRLSSSNPNMQNVPKPARFVYVPSFPDWAFVEGDFAGLENKLAAWYAKDTDRLNRMADPAFDEHRWFASKCFNVPEGEVGSELRKKGKIANHGCDGAMGARTLAKTHDIEEKEAKELILAWRTINSRSAKWQDEVGNEATRKGVLTNAFGRKRWFWSDSSYTEGIRFLPQSSGADVCFRSMIAMLWNRIGLTEEQAYRVAATLSILPEPAQLVLQVHDSLLIECPVELVPEVKQVMKTVMEQPWIQLAGFSIPADIKTGAAGESWGELK